MGRKLTIYAGAPVERVLAAVAEYGEQNRSGRLNSVAERYMAMVDDELARLEFTRAEWLAILGANNDVSLGIDHQPTALLWANLADSPHVGEQFGVDETRLAQRLRALPRSTLLAIREACDRFWARADLPDGEALAAAGIRPADDRLMST
jgi:hypothetical protein